MSVEARPTSRKRYALRDRLVSACDVPSIRETGESATASAMASLTKLRKILPWRSRPASRVHSLIVRIALPE